MKITRTEITQKPSFPEVTPDSLIDIGELSRWKVICGDKNHWRSGVYSPEFDNADQIKELEKHDCPELFILLEGEISLIIFDETQEKIVQLEPLKPLFVNGYHNAFCPNGPFTGKALVIERDSFITEYINRPSITI